MLRKLTPEKTRITDAMIFCIEHAEASDEIIDFITESLNSVKTPIPKKVSSIYKVTTELFYHLFIIFSPKTAGSFFPRIRCVIQLVSQSSQRLQLPFRFSVPYRRDRQVHAPSLRRDREPVESGSLPSEGYALLPCLGRVERLPAGPTHSPTKHFPRTCPG